MAVRPGYKQTEVGVIPEDWEVVPLGRLIYSVEYGSSAKSNTKGQIPVLRMGNLQGGKIDWSDLVFTDNEFEIRKYALNTGDVLFNRTNTIDLVGKTAIYNGERPAIFAGYLIRVNVDGTLLDSKFLNYVLNAEYSRKYSAKVLSVAVGQANINGQKLKTYPIPLPPTLREQQAIAEALSDVDGLISALDALIAKKRALKGGAMQELLTGQRRLPGFSPQEGKQLYKQTEVGMIPQDWAVVTIGDLNPFVTSGSRGWAEFYAERGSPFIRITNLSRGSIYIDLSDLKFVSLSSITAEAIRTQLQVHDVLISITADIGIIGYVNADIPQPAYINQHIALIRFDQSKTDSQYVSYFLASEGPQKLFKASTDVGAKAGMSLLTVQKIQVALPSLAEQTAIAQILADMDAELAALAQKRAKTVALKQGMMQALLTGQVRLG